MVEVEFASKSNSLGLSPGSGHCLVLLCKTLLSLSTQVYKWVLAYLVLEQ